MNVRYEKDIRKMEKKFSVFPRFISIVTLIFELERRNSLKIKSGCENTAA